jgi:hypothetical protein
MIALAKAKKSGTPEEIAAIEEQIAALEAAADAGSDTPASNLPPVVYPVRVFARGVKAKIKDIDVRTFTAPNGKTKVAQINLQQPVYADGYNDDKGKPRPIGAIFLSKKQADTMCRVAQVADLKRLARFIAFSQGNELSLDVLTDEEGNENVLPSAINLSGKVLDMLLDIERRDYERSMGVVSHDAFADEPVTP